MAYPETDILSGETDLASEPRKGNVLTTRKFPGWALVLVALCFLAAGLLGSSLVSASTPSAAAYTPTLQQCQQEAPQTDGVTLTITVTRSRLCEASSNMLSQFYGNGNSQTADIASPNGIAVTTYLLEPVSDPVPSSFVEAVASSGAKLHLQDLSAVPGPNNKVFYSAEPLSVAVFYLPHNAPVGADAFIGERALSSDMGESANTANIIHATDSRFDLPVYGSLLQALTVQGK